MTLQCKQVDFYVIESQEAKLLSLGYVKVDVAIDPGQYSIQKNEKAELSTINWCEKLPEESN